ncbi:thiamine biosynthesis protein [Desulfopila sp. IMCC35006]|uniref:thiamine biosynthesis protein n=1 Tax=Desulfopila sp. IMCC35006 TaxID=2569542 RepID=UPI0010ABA609|nr:thiamine biosynthesis protein [Desulfopila sp. IMCC35006]TKB25294.1 thiamine biosynthesis protein [Desulfopila sp. IMCC35006]
MKKVKGLSLFSGGLDSILATRVVMEQGIEVEAIQFVTPFFNYDILADIPAHKSKMLDQYGIYVEVEDISPGYLRLLHNPAHGFGKNFNPCIDCKIMMFARAKQLLAEKGASFLISGEILGQRPMSQRRDTMNVIERDSGTKSILLRPLCAQLMQETAVEAAGLVDRSKLLAMNGRSRSPQIELAAKYGITDFPSPAGGCILADPILSKRIAQFYAGDSVLQSAEICVPDIRALLVGRQFILPGGGWLIVGRDEKDNNKLEKLIQAEDARLEMEEWPGPLAVLKKAGSQYPDHEKLEIDLQLAAALVVRYGRKLPENIGKGEVTCLLGTSRRLILAAPLADKIFREWQLS